MQSATLDIQVDVVLPGLHAASGGEVLQLLAMEIARHTEVEAKAAYQRLVHSEEVQNSAIGGGVAIPHLQMPGLSKPLTLLARLENPLDMQSSDQQLIDLVCLVVSPKEDGPVHLQRLARISRALRDELLCSHLRAAKTMRDMFAALRPAAAEQLLAA